MGCYEPPLMPMSKLMKWWDYHQSEPGAFPGNVHPLPVQRKARREQTIDDQLSILRGVK